MALALKVIQNHFSAVADSRILRPIRSGGVPVLVDHSGELVPAAYVQTCDTAGIDDGFGDVCSGAAQFVA